MQAGERARIDLVGLDVRLGDRLHLQRIGDDDSRHKGRQHARHRHAVAGRLDHHFINRPEALAQSFEGGPGHVDPAGMSEDPVFPDHHLAEGSVNIDANHASHARLPLVAHDGSGGRHDNYGFALTAQPGESQRRPATNTSSQLIVRVGLPAPSCSRRLCPGWSHHTPRSRKPQPDFGAAHLIPVTNAIERLHEEFKRRIKTQTVLPSAETAAMLFWALLASGQIMMRKVDGWQTLATSPVAQPIDLAA